jgi:hypothetical protein
MPLAQTCAWSALSEYRILPNALLGSHAVKLFGYVETQQKGSWIKDHSLSDREGAARSIDFDWLCATPGTIGLTMKSIEKFSFGHHGSRSYSQSRRHARTRGVAASISFRDDKASGREKERPAEKR